MPFSRNLSIMAFNAFGPNRKSVKSSLFSSPCSRWSSLQHSLLEMAQSKELDCSDCREPTTIEDSCVISKASGENGQSIDIRRCKQCNRVRSRIQRFSKTNEDLVYGFQRLDAPSRKDFLLKCSELMGGELKKALEETIIQNYCKKQSTMFTGTGVFLDKDDLTAKYHDCCKF